MVVQNIDLNMIPESSPVVVHVNQYDVGEGRIVASLYNGAQEYTPASGATAVIQGMKPDGKGFDYNATLSGSTVTANVTEQMTAVEGKTRCQIVITEGNNVTGTFVFYLMVQKSALPADADMSQSEYSVVMQLLEQAEALNQYTPYIGANGNWWVYSVQAGEYVDTGVDASISVNIADITMLAPDATPYVTNSGTATDPIFHLFIPRGKGISSIAKTGTSGLVDTYTITYSDGATTTFTVTNGADGAQGPTGPQGATGPQGPKGDKGDKGDTGTTDAEILIRDTVGWTGKNLLKIPSSVVGKTEAGITFTVNRDVNGIVESIKVNGTSTNVVSLYLANPIYLVSGQKYIISDGGVGTNDCFLRVGNSADSFVVATRNGEAEFTADTSNYIRITVESGKTINNVIFKPMLRKADLTDPTYEPYHETVEQCKFDRSEQRVLGAKNLLPNTGISRTVTGITFTVNTDGLVNVNGTASTGTYFKVAEYSLPKGNYIASKGYNSDSSHHCGLIVEAYNGSTYVKTLASSYSIDEQMFTVDYVGYDRVKVSLVVAQGDVISNLTVYPMIRLASDPDDTYAPYAMTNREITEELTVQESAATGIVSGATVNQNDLVKYGKVVQFSLRLNNTTATAWSTVLCNIPTEYRPKASCRLRIANLQAAFISVTANDGNVYVSADLSANQLEVSGTWITS